ncbi:MAG: glycine hydroxymethyltransferase [Verrucomicrobia bacterium]|nr:glycine hydroxymethyltransferase [Verrucomicrobiota bacterium]
MSHLEKYFNRVPAEKRTNAAIAYMASLDHIRTEFPLIEQRIVQELKDQRTHLKLIASENFSSLAVQLAMGNLLTDKYAEGVPFRRFYAGCDNVDAIEAAACDEAKKLFNCDHVYVQPHSGADANLVAFWAMLVYRVQNKEVERLGKKSIDELTAEEYESVRKLLVGQKVMGMSLNSGGHLTHGYRHNISAKIMQSVPYEINRETGVLDYAQLQEQVKREKPAILIAGYSAYPRLINFAKMREIADSVGAMLMVDMAHFAGLVAGKVMKGEFDPVPFAHIVTTTTHKTLRGPRGGMVLCKNELKDVVDKGCPIVLGGPLPQVMAAKAIAFKEANTISYQQYAHQIVANSRALAQQLMKKGVKLTTGGTDNHLIVFDVASTFGITGRQAELALREARLTVNRNTLPFDTNGAWYTSGVRIGTPAVTTLGMKELDMVEIADAIVELLQNTKPAVDEKGPGMSRARVDIDPKALAVVQKRVSTLLSAYPLYPELVID